MAPPTDNARRGPRLRPLLFFLVLTLPPALYVRVRHEASRRHARPDPIAYLHAQLQLDPVLAAEAELRRQDTRENRLRLERVCAATGDWIGALLALYPLAQETTDPALLARYADYCVRLGWLEDAEAILDRLSARPTPLVLRLAAEQVLFGRAGAAEQTLAALESEPLDPDQWLDGAVTLARGRRYARAIAWARRGVLARYTDPHARMVLARCYLAAGQPEQALRVLPPPGERFDVALETWRGRAELRCRDPARRRAGRERLLRVLEVDRYHHVAMFEVGRALLEEGDARGAEPYLAGALQNQYQEILGWPLLARCYREQGLRAAALWAEARALTASGKLAEAEDRLRQALAIEPNNVPALIDLAQAHLILVQLEPALATVERVESLRPNDFYITFLHARTLWQLERIPAAIEKFHAAAKLDPKRAQEALTHLGSNLFDAQRYDEAIRTLEQSIALNDNDFMAHLVLGRSYARIPERREAMERAAYHLVRAGLLRPGYYFSWVNAGVAFESLGAHPEAAACFRRAINSESLSDSAYVKLARFLQLDRRQKEREFILAVYEKRRGYDQRRSKLEQDADRNPGDPDIQFAIGELVATSGRPIDAFPYLMRATALRPTWRAAWRRYADVCALLDYDDLRVEAERHLRS